MTEAGPVSLRTLPVNASAEGRQRHLLVVDDDNRIRELLKE